MNSINKKILAIIASGVTASALALAAPSGGGAAIGPVNDSPTTTGGTNTGTQKMTPATNQTGTMPPNAQSSAGGSGGKMSTGVKTNTSVKSNSKVKTTSPTRR